MVTDERELNTLEISTATRWTEWTDCWRERVMKTRSQWTKRYPQRTPPSADTSTHTPGTKEYIDELMKDYERKMIRLGIEYHVNEQMELKQ